MIKKEAIMPEAISNGREGTRVLVPAVVEKRDRDTHGTERVAISIGSYMNPHKGVYVAPDDLIPLEFEGEVGQNAALRVALAKVREKCDGLPVDVARDIVRVIDFALADNPGARLARDVIESREKVRQLNEGVRSQRDDLLAMRGNMDKLAAHIRHLRPLIETGARVLDAIDMGRDLQVADDLVDEFRQAVRVAQREQHSQSRLKRRR